MNEARISHRSVSSFVLSEPGGVANFLEKSALGLRTTARLVNDGKYWELKGKKLWATNSARGDFKGTDPSCVVCRDIINPPSSRDENDPKDAIIILLVTRADIDASALGAFETIRHITTVGLPSISSPHIRYNNVCVPARNVLCPPGQGADVAIATFDASAVPVTVMRPDLLRTAFNAALAFAKCDDRCGVVQLFEREMAVGVKVYSSEAVVQTATDASQTVGITAYDADQPFENFFNNAIVLPIVDLGNEGIRKRQLQQLMLTDLRLFMM
ncbi:hypothetical protein M406DRAFT_332504 [Cryphonectria parasitica EP155]|uniref:Acyl-CoA dehydrogenase/oxidase C-terminal domain-containing protein n=1 Tax=Cryphonectria parasitica (strain ATCC 38755 / EP155) TaxID=660469 RepID=A0A9P5CLD4_CRYP1|nr:uncharacterized protein M406DRAFT_332504 [Cryphonectria parasitica EP155]KAF3762107.1 hypothetical protein M406DRAFT_332504 [Cryphonectria parasitica EP155]